jgi:hypothetical protein
MSRTRILILIIIIGSGIGIYTIGSLFYAELQSVEIPTVIENTETEIGDDLIKMVQNYTLVEQTVHASNTIKDINNIRNIGYYDSKYWWGENSGDVLTIKSCPVSNLNTSATSEHTFDGSAPYEPIGTNALLCIFDDEIYCATIYNYLYTVAPFPDQYVIIVLISYSTNGGSTWTDSKVSIGLTADLYDFKIVDFIRFSSGSVKLIWSFSNDNSLYFHNVVAETYFDSYSGMKTLNSYYLGQMIDDLFYFIVQKADDSFVILSLSDAAVITEVETLSNILAPTTWNPFQQLYYKTDKIEFFFDQEHFYTRKIGMTTWSSYSGSGESVSGVIWSNNATTYQYEIKYIVWKDSLYEAFPSGLYVRIADLSDYNAIYCGYDPIIIDSGDSKVYELELAAISNVQQCTVTETIYNGNGPRCNFDLTTEPFVNQTYVLYDDSDNLVYVGYVQTFDYDFEQYKCVMRSLIGQDLGQKVSVSYTDKTTHYILKDIIDTYCLFIYYDDHISDTPTDEYTIAFKNKTVLDVIRWCDSAEGYLTTVRPDGECYYDQGTASGTTITVDTDNVSDIKYNKSPLKLSYIKIYGGWDEANNQRFESEKLGEPNFGRYSDWFPEINNQTDLDAMRDKILAEKNIELESVRLIGVLNKNPLYLNQTFTLTSSRHSISADTYYIDEVKTDYKTTREIMEVRANNALYVKPVNVNDVQKQLNNLNQYADDINTNKMDKTGTSTQTLSLKVNEASALDITEGANSYLKFTTTVGSEKITVGKEFAMGMNKITGLGDPTAAQDAVTLNHLTTKPEIGDGVGTDFKKQKAGVVQWGTSGNLTDVGWTSIGTDPTTKDVYNSDATHVYVGRVVTAAGGAGGLKYDSGGAISLCSFWAKAAQTNVQVNLLTYNGVGTYGMGFVFDNVGYIRWLTSNAAAFGGSIIKYSADTWYHFLMYNDSTNIYYYINGVLAYKLVSYTNQNIFQFYMGTASKTAYIDALYIGASLADAWATYFSSPLKFLTTNDGIVTPLGIIPNKLHKCICRLSADESFSDGAWKGIPWDVAYETIGGMWSSAASTKIYFPRSGFYKIEVHVSFQNRIGQWYGSIEYNATAGGTAPIAVGAVYAASASWYYHLNMSVHKYFKAGDYIVINIYNQTGAAQVAWKDYTSLYVEETLI